MNSKYEFAILASDVLKEILVKSDKGEKILTKIVSGKFGKEFYATNMTISAVLYALSGNKNATQQSREIIFQFMPEDMDKERSITINDIRVTREAWLKAWGWYVDAKFRKALFKDTPFDMEILSWCDIAMIKADRRFKRIITEIPYYEVISDITKKVKKLDKDRIWEFPKFDVVS